MPTNNHSIERRNFVSRLVGALPDALIVTGLGSPSYDVFASGDRNKTFYLWGAMGGAISMGLGIALAQKDKEVVVITGDGESLMGIGSLATVGIWARRSQCENITSSSIRCRLAPCFKRPGKKSLRR